MQGQRSDTPAPSTRPARRVLRMQMFLGSTLEEIEPQLSSFLNENGICVGNYVDVKLHKLGNVYQLVLVYAELVEETGDERIR